MLAITSQTIERAVEKAKRTRTKVRMLSFRRYEVTNAQGVKYVVTFDVRGSQRLASCTCKARVCCYHIAGSLQAHLIIQRMRAESSTGH